MRILICDDDPLAIEQIHKNLKSFFTYKHIKCPEVISYSCGEDLLNDTGNKDIVFLDIEMPVQIEFFVILFAEIAFDITCERVFGHKTGGDRFVDFGFQLGD